MYTILSPVLSEKTTLGMENGLYVLSVTESATKSSVKKDLKIVHSVDATSVRILNLPGKKVRFKGKKGVRNGRRKAYVQLKTGQHLPGFEIKKEKETKKSDKKTEAEETK